MRNLSISIVVLSWLVVGAAACGSDEEGGGGTGGSGSGLCVGDERAAAGCAVSWELVDPCPSSGPSPIPNATIELAVFADGCPNDEELRSGGTASAIYRETFSPIEPFAAVTGLEKKSYGFAFLARSLDCVVVAFGCTTADLAQISAIKTAVCDWAPNAGDPICTCHPASGGGCPLPETCSAGSCSGATSG